MKSRKGGKWRQWRMVRHHQMAYYPLSVPGLAFAMAHGVIEAALSPASRAIRATSGTAHRARIATARRVNRFPALCA